MAENKGGTIEYIKNPAKSDMENKELLFDHKKDVFLRVLRDRDHTIIIQTVRRKSLCYSVADAKRLHEELTKSIEWAESFNVKVADQCDICLAYALGDCEGKPPGAANCDLRMDERHEADLDYVPGLFDSPGPGVE